MLRHGKYVLTEHHLDRAEKIVSGYGGVVVLPRPVHRGLREANGIIAGITGMRWQTFTFYNVIGGCAWVATWVSVGDLAGDHIGTIYPTSTRTRCTR